jgi:hypothetical protein
MQGTSENEHDRWMEKILGAVRSLRATSQLKAEPVRERPLVRHANREIADCER